MTYELIGVDGQGQCGKRDEHRCEVDKGSGRDNNIDWTELGMFSARVLMCFGKLIEW